MSSRCFWVFAVGSTVALATGCQSYDFEPVEPFAFSQKTEPQPVYGRRFKPSLMFLIDKSGSMNFPSNSAAAGCPAGCGVSTGPCPATCPTRISELRAAMNTFLTGTGAGVAWTGMAIFPTKVTGDACGATVAGDVVVQLAQNKTDLDADIKAAAMTVNTQIQSLVPGGGTPTADSLRFLTSYPPLTDNPEGRAQFVLLLTDGLPNCNSSNPNTCSNGSPLGAACKCTLASCSAAFCAQGCLDKDNSAAAIVELEKKNINTIVIGFGADTSSGDGPDTLNAMAEAGGFARTCQNGTDAECGANNACNVSTKVCNKQFYQATSAAELATVLADIGKAIDPTGICTLSLNEIPKDPRFLAVSVDGKDEPKGASTWTYSAGAVTFAGALCDKMKQATSVAPVNVEFRIVNAL